MLNAGDEFFNAAELDSALVLSEEAISIYQILNYQGGIAYGLGNIGLIYAEQGKKQAGRKKHPGGH